MTDAISPGLPPTFAGVVWAGGTMWGGGVPPVGWEPWPGAQAAGAAGAFHGQTFTVAVDLAAAARAADPPSACWFVGPSPFQPSGWHPVPIIPDAGAAPPTSPAALHPPVELSAADVERIARRAAELVVELLRKDPQR